MLSLKKGKIKDDDEEGGRIRVMVVFLER